MRRSLASSSTFTSVLLLIILLHDASSAADEMTVTAVMEESQDKYADVHVNTKGERTEEQNGQPQVVHKQKKSLIDVHYRNKNDSLTKILHRILLQKIPFPSFNFNRKRQEKNDVVEFAEKEKDLQIQQQSQRISNNLGQNNIGIVKVMGASRGNFNNKNVRWVRAWCPPSTSGNDYKAMEVIAADECKSDKHVSSGVKNKQCTRIDDVSASDLDDDDDVQPGVVFYVDDSDFSGSGSGSGDNALLTVTAGGVACVTLLGQQYDPNRDILQYTLLRQVSHLGNIDVHKRDFAYHPVVVKIASDDNFSVGQHKSDGSKKRSRSNSKELEARRKVEDEAIEAFGKIYSHSPWTQRNDDGDGNDHKISFRWWSWFTHLSQMFHRGHFHNTVDKAQRYNHNKQHLSYQSNIYEETGKFAFAGGSHGEVWRARRRCPSSTPADAENEKNSSQRTSSSSCDDGKDLIVKRLKIEQGYAILEAGLREVYFGELLAREVDSPMLFTTYIDHFFREGRRGQVELWIVFENAGPSLRSYLYEATVADGFVVFQHSAFWRRLRVGISGCSSRTTVNECTNSRDETQAVEGRHLLKEVLKQILNSVAFLHERGITHRDIKPSNILCQTTPSSQEGNIPDKILDVNCVLADFSSGYDDFADRNLYSNGPSAGEQTDEYAPPEVLLQDPSAWEPFSSANPYSYDSWSIGVVALELMLGTPNVFSVDQRTTALLTNKLRNDCGASSCEIKKALYLAALSQFCIYVPTNGMSWPLRKGDPLHDASVAKHSCTLHDFHNALRARDPLGVGFKSSADLLLHLIWRLLDMDPLTRLSPADALLHPYFSSNTPYDDGYSLSHELLLQRQPLNDLMVPGSHNALEHQTLDPQVDMKLLSDVSDFVCPKCGKKFLDHNSCQRHARSRGHAQFCLYDTSFLPPCLHAHSMLPTHATSGYCDIQGRRNTIEDFHTIHLNQNHQFYGIFDGHLGNIASKFSASSFYDEVQESLSTLDDEIKSSDCDRKWKEKVAHDIEQSFHNLHEGILKAIDSSPAGVMREAGTTATILYVTELAVVIANVGDSRAVLSRWDHDGNKKKVTGLQLTIDHVASSPKEQEGVIERGGFISSSGGIDRVNGSLSVSRSLGDVLLAPYLSRIPHVLALTKEEVHRRCGQDPDLINEPCFIVVASDGLWDVVDNQEAVDFVEQVLRRSKNSSSYQTAAQLLTQEAYVRGSSDNIGVLIVAL